MPAVAIPLLPVIVTKRPKADQFGVAYAQLPAGVDPGALRLMAAVDVRDGDYCLGDCEQPTERGMFRGVHAYTAFTATPSAVRRDGALALDGESYIWRPDELLMVVPREALAASRR